MESRLYSLWKDSGLTCRALRVLADPQRADAYLPLPDPADFVGYLKKVELRSALFGLRVSHGGISCKEPNDCELSDQNGA